MKTCIGINLVAAGAFVFLGAMASNLHYVSSYSTYREFVLVGAVDEQRLNTLDAPYPEPGETGYNMLARIRQVGNSAWWFTFISWLAAAACILNAVAFSSCREQVRAMKAEGLVEELKSK